MLIINWLHKILKHLKFKSKKLEKKKLNKRVLYNIYFPKVFKRTNYFLLYLKLYNFHSRSFSPIISYSKFLRLKPRLKEKTYYIFGHFPKSRKKYYVYYTAIYITNLTNWSNRDQKLHKCLYIFLISINLLILWWLGYIYLS